MPSCPVPNGGAGIEKGRLKASPESLIVTKCFSGIGVAGYGSEMIAS
jgi:hypothetical protein